MMKRNICALVTILLLFSTAIAQDVIVKKDGSAVLSKVLEVSPTDIKYKKHSNPNGPTYTMIIADVLAINYENGEKDEFNISDSAISSSTETDGNPVSSEAESINQLYIDTYNSLNIEFVKEPKDKGKEADGALCLIGIKEGSQMHNDDLTASIIIGGIDIGKTDQFTTKGTGFFSDRLLVLYYLKNNSDKILYIDLANTFMMRNKMAEPYYKPSAKSTSVGSSSGVGVNLGSIASAFGIGGVIGQLAGGTSIGSSTTNVTTTTTFSQRVVAIPPRTALTLAPKWIIPKNTNPYPNIGGGFVFRYKFSNLLVGSFVSFSYEESPMKFSLFITYAKDESFSNPHEMNVDYYLRKAVGVPVSGAGSLSAQPYLKKNTISPDWVKLPLVMIYNRNPK